MTAVAGQDSEYNNMLRHVTPRYPIRLRYYSTQLAFDEDSATQYFSEDTEKELSEESDSSSHGSKPQLAPAHEWSDDCVSEKTARRGAVITRC